MKNLRELYNEIIRSDEQKKAFAEAMKNNTVVEFAKAHGVDTSLEEMKDFLKNLTKGTDKKLTDEEAANVAGGECNNTTTAEVETSIIWPVLCGVAYVVSGVGSLVSDDYSVGQQAPGEGRLCNVEMNNH